MQTIKLSTTPGVVNPGAYLSQYDVGRQIKFLLFDDAGAYTPATGSTVSIRATKPSGFGFDVTCTWNQNEVTATVTDDMSNEFGSFAAELRITKDSAILGTCNFLWNVERGPHQEGTVDGNTEAKGLMQAIMAAIADAENAAAAAAHAGLSEDLKQALLECFEHVAWIDEQGQDYYDALYDALYPPVPATGIRLNRSTLRMLTLNSTETLVATVVPAGTSDTVEWSSSDPTVASVDQTGKVTALAYGSATITATAGAVSATCSVAVAELTSITAVFTQGTHTVYSDDSLDSLKQYLVVTATYSDSTTEEVPASDYTLSGTLEAGTSTITATYGEETDTFEVTVTQAIQYYAIVNNLTHVASSNPTVTVEENDSFTTSLGVQTGYTLQSVIVTMGSVDVTAEVYDTDTRQIIIAAVTGNVVITAEAVMTPASITAVFDAGSTTIYSDDSLDSLKQYLVVTATYPDSSTAVIPSTDYTLSGTLTVGTSTITVNYGGKTDTISVNVSSEEWTVVQTIGDNYSAGQLSLSTGEVDAGNTDWYTSGFISVPDGATSFSRITSRTSDNYFVWYDENYGFIGNGLNGAYSGNGGYGGGYTDGNDVLWNVVPKTAKYARVSWRTSATFTSITFAKNKQLKANVTPIANKLYFYTYDAESTGSYISCDDYLKCENMAYVQIRPVIRRSITFYDSEYIQVSQIATANNIGTNAVVPDDAVYLKMTNANAIATGAGNVTRIGYGLIMFTDETKTSW